jgi:hypothetical protein
MKRAAASTGAAALLAAAAAWLAAAACLNPRPEELPSDTDQPPLFTGLEGDDESAEGSGLTGDPDDSPASPPAVTPGAGPPTQGSEDPRAAADAGAPPDAGLRSLQTDAEPGTDDAPAPE